MRLNMFGRLVCALLFVMPAAQKANSCGIDPEQPGMECYAGEAKGGFEFFLWSPAGKRLSDSKEIVEGGRESW